MAQFHRFLPFSRILPRWLSTLPIGMGLALAAASPGTRHIEKVTVNQPPETIITSGPPDSTAGTSYRVQFFWNGSDPDLGGSIHHYEFILVDHPRSKDSILPGGSESVIVTVPSPDDPRWTQTTATDSVFVTLADTLRRDPWPHPGETPDDVRLTPFERWHTFFVRAVDDQGLPDPTPDYRTFNARTVAPAVALVAPVQAGLQFSCPPLVAMHWTGVDPDAFAPPDSSRWVLIPSRIDLADPDKYTSFPESLYVLPSRFQWSPWRAWDAEDGSGVRAALPGLLRVGDSPGSGYYLFAVQAKDEAGAVTPVFDWQTPQRNNVALIRVIGSTGPLLTVSEPDLGMANFIGGSHDVTITAAAGQDLHFRWSADASTYGGTIEAYRFGWDLLVPEGEVGWSPWSLDRTAPPQSFASGTHSLHIEARDDLGTTTRAGFQIHVLELTGNRDLLWVDDSDFLTDIAMETNEDARWIDVLTQVALANDLQFDSELDVYDVVENGLLLPPAQKIFDYRFVIWSSRNGRDGSSALRRAAQFSDPYPQRNHNDGGAFNELNAYVRGGGRLWINGFRPDRQLWPDERERGQEPAVVNVTNWNDPIEPHPGVDSVGTASLLYKMGVEMFDVGAALDSRRNRSNQFCYGLAGAFPMLPELQPGPGWGQGGTAGRSSVSIYNMPLGLTAQNPPLSPAPERVRVLYTYVSGLPENPATGFVYPQTADKQPLFIVSKRSPDDPFFSTALCGFEPFLLTAESHVQLVNHIVTREMGLIPTPVLLETMTIDAMPGAVRIDWRVPESSRSIEFLLQAKSEQWEWTVPWTTVASGAFTATDDSPHLASGTTVTYLLYGREDGSDWALLAQRLVEPTTPPRVPRLWPPRPNPFNPATEVSYVLPERQHLRLRVLGCDGRSLVTLVDAIRPAGPGQLIWDGRDGNGRQLAAGIYVVRLEAGGAAVSRKVVLLK